MFGFAIAAAIISPVAYLATGFYRVSLRRAEEGRENLAPVYRSVIEPANAPSVAPNTALVKEDRIAA